MPISRFPDKAHAVAKGRKKGPFSLVLGVTGHRNLRQEDVAGLEARVREVVVLLGESNPETPLMLLSPLAEGADRLVARVALELGVSLVVPLPMPRHLYEMDFKSEASLNEFADLIGNAAQWFALPAVDPSAGSCDPDDSEFRNRQYALVGAFVAKHSHILIALWDGLPSKHPGSTAQVVQFKLKGVPEAYGPPSGLFEPVESGLVYHILTPRTSNPDLTGVPLALAELSPDGASDGQASAASYTKSYERMNEFNRDAVRFDAKLAGQREASRSALVTDSEEISLPQPLEHIARLFSTADALALHYRKLTLRILSHLLVLSFFAAFFLKYDGRWSTRLYLVSLFVAFGVYRWVRRGNHQNKYLDYRALAEGLRVQFFWLLFGLQDEVADHYLRTQKSELDWIRNAIRAASIGASGDAPPGGLVDQQTDFKKRITAVLSKWVQDQEDYFTRAASRDHKKMVYLNRVASGFFVVGVVWTFLRAFRISNDDIETWIRNRGLSASGSGLLHNSIYAISLAPVISGLLLAYVNTSALSEHAKQYGRMSALFTSAREHLSQLVDSERIGEAELLIRELGREALTEHGSWLLLHRQRKLPRPKI
jgi:hypothetical protein